MAHHAYLFSGDLEKGIASALSYGARELGLSDPHSPDVLVFRFPLFSVEDARLLREVAERTPLMGDSKLIVISTGRIFHEAQNALLKLFEEPPRGVTLVLCVPSDGILIPTLRSRLLPLPETRTRAKSEETSIADEFLSGTTAAREKLVAKLLERAKSDNDEEKQGARLEALSLMEGILRAAYEQFAETGKHKEFLEDVSAFIPILHTRSAPLKPIFEHLLLTIPPGLRGA